MIMSHTRCGRQGLIDACRQRGPVSSVTDNPSVIGQSRHTTSDLSEVDAFLLHFLVIDRERERPLFVTFNRTA